MFLCLTCSLITCFGVYLVCIHLVLLFLLENLVSGFSIAAQYLLDSCLIPHRYMPLLSRFLGCFLSARYLLDLSKSFYYRYLLDTSRSIKILFSLEARYLLNISSYVFTFISEVQPCFVQNQISQSLSLLSLSKPNLFTKNLPPFKFSA